jgi:GNAT superfamily N-acetyltransferase
MATLVRRVDIDKERVPLTAFLSRYLSAQADSTRYEWLYFGNPSGKGMAWQVFASDTSQIIGVAAAFPRHILYQGKETLGYVMGDFCIHPDYRTLGPAVALQRRCLEEIWEQSAGPVFDFPSASMLAIYKRLQIDASASMVRFAKPLRVNRIVDRRISDKRVAAGVAAVANAGLRLRDAALRPASEWVIEEQTAPCGEEFTSAARQWSCPQSLGVLRTAEYLNWRYLKHPYRRYRMWTARAAGKLCGFLVYHLDSGDASIVDLLAEGDGVIKALLLETVAQARDQNVNTLSFPFLNAHPGRKLLENCGFRPREASPVVLLASQGKPGRQVGDAAIPWYLTHGDRES